MHPAERELLDTILTLVEERRINAGQAYEAAKRRLNDADNPYAREGEGRNMDIYKDQEKRYKALAAEIDAVISEEHGHTWRIRDLQS